MPINPPLRLKLRTARALSLLVLVVMPMGYLGGAIWPDHAGGVWLPFAMMRLVGLFAGVFLFVDIRNQRANAGDAILDERERAERARARDARTQARQAHAAETPTPSAEHADAEPLRRALSRRRA